MGVYHVRLPDVGEGIAEAELVSWLVAVGDVVTQESPLAEVLTDKATVEISSPVEGTVVYLTGTEGQVMAIGTEFVGIEIEGDAPDSRSSKQSASAVAETSSTSVAPATTEPATNPEPGTTEPATTEPATTEPATTEPAEPATTEPAAPAPLTEVPAPPSSAPAVPVHGRAVAAPAVRRRASELGVDLSTVVGSGPDGRVLHSDLDRVVAGSGGRSAAGFGAGGTRETPIIGLRRRISQRMSEAWSDIPHITYVDEIDATELEALRKALNHQRPAGPRLTLLPFIAKAIVMACADSPECNAHFDSAGGVVTQFAAVHVGVATQTPGGLVVPVLRNAESRSLWNSAAEISRLAAAAREGKATGEELSGSTITITSLGAMGGLVTTPIINRPEVAIVGVNAMQIRPVWRDGAFVPRSMFNLSSSFDHRIVDGWVAATFVQRIKALLEIPALLFTDTQS